MKRLHMLLIVVLALMLAAFAIWGLLWIYGSKSKVPNGTEAAGLPLGGLHKAEALQLLETYRLALDNRVVTLADGTPSASSGEDKPVGAAANDGAPSGTAAAQNQAAPQLESADGSISATAERSASWALDELGLRINLDAAVAAISKLGEGSVLERAKYRWNWGNQLPVTLASNRKQFDAAIRKQWGFYDERKPVDAVRTITPYDKVVYTPGRNVLHLDLERQHEGILRWAAKGLGNNEAEQPGGGIRSSAKLKPSRLPQLDGPGLLAALGVEAGWNGTLQFRSVAPKVTLASLKAEGVERLIASFSTDYRTSSQGRAFNVSETARTLNGWMLKPGEVFDYGEIIRITERETGYREAPVILNGQFTRGIGGGICQVSSTLYNAALRAGLEIVERRHHSLPVSYLPKGQDATFAEGSINFRFRNTTGKHLIIRTYTGSGQLTIKLFGTMPKEVRYSIVSRTVRTLSPPVRLRRSSGLAPGQQVVLKKGKTGYIVETYRIRYENGKEVSRTRISRDTYKPQPAVIMEGPASAPIPPSPGPGSEADPHGAEEAGPAGGAGTPQPQPQPKDRQTFEELEQMPDGSSPPTEPPLLEDGIRLLGPEQSSLLPEFPFVS
ncbi:VanW family protein [Paenibacillus pasadenensis]|uniref:VanW family protein n=1 Tax=Paenibacillus pasadenensis TaxID=217090 RepID=UPI0020426A1C|nr:VanW family protein [Paenibacillus pasadenensis]